MVPSSRAGTAAASRASPQTAELPRGEGGCRWADRTRGARRRWLGIAISIEDGDKSRRASSVAALGALQSLGVVDEAEAASIEESEDWPPTSDSLGRTVTEARAVFSLA